MTSDTMLPPSPLTLVEEALAKGNRQEALAALTAAAHELPHDEEVPLLAASLCLELERPGEAAEWALRSLAIRPFHPAAVDALGVACTDALDPELAQKVLRRGLRMTPGMENMKSNLAVARRTAKGLRRGAYARDEAARLGATLPHGPIESWLATRAERLAVAVAVHDATATGLARCLESVAGLADELLVADARDERETPLRVPGGTTVLAVAVDDDAPPHEHLRRRARSDWILFLQADEWLGGGTLRDELEALDGRALAATFELIDACGSRRRVLRCVRNVCSLQCRGRVVPRFGDRLALQEDRWGLETVALGSMLRRERGSRRNDGEELAHLIARLDADLAADSGDRAARLDRAWVHLDQGELEEAHRLVQPLRRALEEEAITRRRQEMEEPVTLEALCYLVAGRPDDLLDLLEKYHGYASGSANTFRLEATAMLAAGEAARALQRLRLATDAAPGLVPALPQLSPALLAGDVGAALLEKGLVDEARIAFGLALDAEPEHLEARLGNLALDFASGRIEAVLHEMDRLADSDGGDRRVWLTGAIVLGQHGELAQVAVDWLAEGCRRHPDDEGMRRRLGEAQLLAGQPVEALASWDDLPDDSGELAAARFAATLAAESTGELPVIADDTVDAVIGWLGAWLDREVWEPLDRALVRLPELRERKPVLVSRTAAWLSERGQSEAADRLIGPR